MSIQFVAKCLLKAEPISCGNTGKKSLAWENTGYEDDDIEIDKYLVWLSGINGPIMLWRTTFYGEMTSNG